MTISFPVVVRCDGCQYEMRWAPVGGLTLDEIRVLLAERGWGDRDGADLCVSCVAELRAYPKALLW